MKRTKTTGLVKVYLWTLMTALLISVQSFAQDVNRKITGTVTSVSDSKAISGASVRVKGKGTGASTDATGKFTVSAKTGDVLQVSNVGFEDKEVTVGEGNTIDVALTEVKKVLDDIVVVGYGTQKKKVVTGATVRVGSEDLEKNHALRIDQALQGQAAGVNITSNSGQPGESMKIVIRGIATNGNSNPLYVVDGVPTDDINYINPTDITSIDVLKDAASAAIYGVRGANGVVLVTTRKGRAGTTRITADASYGWQNPARKVPMLNATEYATIMNEAAVNSGKSPYYYFSADQIKTMGKGTDWQKAVTNKNAPTQNYSVNFNGGNDQSIYSSTLGYQKQEGIIGLPGKSYYERISFSLNSDHKVYKDFVHFGENLNYSHSNQSGIGTGNIYGNSIRGLLNTSPVFPVYNADGTYAHSTMSSEESNPVASMDSTQHNKTITDRVVGNIYLEATIIKGLKLRSDFGLDASFYSTNSFTPIDSLSTTNVASNSTVNMGFYRNYAWNWDNTISYQRAIGKHNFTVLAGTSAYKHDYWYVTGSRQGMMIEDFDHAVIEGATNTATQKGTGSHEVNTLQSYFGRLNYNYDEKYLLTGIVRRDGSSMFGENFKHAIFPSVSAGWVVTNEDFLKLNWLNFLKIRGGWGRVGNDKIKGYSYEATVSSSYQSYYFGGSDGSQSVGTSPDKVPNSNLKWEGTEQADFGFDATLFRSLNVTVDWYNKTTKDWLVQVPVPDIVGTGAPYINGGNVTNKGVEVSVNYQHKFGQVNFSIGGNVAFNTNIVKEVPNQDGIIHGSSGILASNSTEFYRVQSGYPLGYFWGYQTGGIFQSEAQINSYTNKTTGKLIQPDAKPGDVIFVDRNGDGSITTLDKTNIGSPIPKETYGFNVSANYKGFDVAVLLNGSIGNKIVDGTRANDRYYNNYTTQILGRWTGEGTSNYIPRVTLGDEANGNWTNFSDLSVHSGSFLRVKSVNVGYDLKRTLLRHMGVQQIRLYFSATNLFTFTKYKGMDPEVGYGYDSWSSGVDLGYYPQPRTLLVGVNVKL